MPSNYTAKQPNSQGIISYSNEDQSVWHDLYNAQYPNIKRYAASVHQQGIEALGLNAHSIPQCKQLSAQLHAQTGWSVQPVAALIPFKQFFTLLANRTFPAASFIRSRQDFKYIEEPDIFHEVFGHTPLLVNQHIADFSQLIGQIGQSLPSQSYAWLARLYWFTIEFGLLNQQGTIKPLGAGLASSPSELIHAANSQLPERRPFNLIDLLRTPYRIDIHQPLYYVLDALSDLSKLNANEIIRAIKQAQALGLFAPMYQEKTQAA